MFFRTSFFGWADLFRDMRAVVSSIFSGGPYEGAWGSPGTKTSAAHLLSRRIRTSEVTSGPLCLRPHDMPMARYTTSRL
jgi:hypothetical protein